jgi:glucose dehydrogenase
MTIWARDVDTGAVKWVYQMTPHDEWDYDGVNEMILTDEEIDGKDRKLLTHFDRNGFGYTLDRATGELLVANNFDPKVNWATGINMDKASPDYGRPIRVKAMSTQANGEDTNSNFIAWDGKTGKIVWSDPEQFSVWSGALATAGGVVFYGTLEGYLKAVDAKTGKELYKLKTPSGIIGNVMTYEHGGRQYVAILSGVGGWAGIGLAAGLTKPTDGLGAVGGDAALSDYTARGGTLTVFALSSD